MPRKNRNVRLAQAKQTLEAFKAAGYMSHESKLSFMKDMIQRLERGKHLTKRQREWLDIIIEEGVQHQKETSNILLKLMKHYILRRSLNMTERFLFHSAAKLFGAGTFLQSNGNGVIKLLRKQMIFVPEITGSLTQKPTKELSWLFLVRPATAPLIGPLIELGLLQFVKQKIG